MIIYKTTNLLNGKYYVGKDEKNNPDYLGSGLLLNRAIKKHGRENFKKEILEICVNRKELNEREKYWIKELKAIENGYNIALGGAGGDTYTNNPNLSDIIEKLSGEKNHFYGKNHSDEAKDKIGESKLGRPSWNKGKTGVYSEEFLKNLSKIRKEKYSGVNHPRYKEISKDVLIELLKVKTPKEISLVLNCSYSCVLDKLILFEIDYKKEKINRRIGKTPNYYEISDELFNEILNERTKNKKTIVELSKIFKIGIHKLSKEFRKRNNTEKVKRIS